MFNHSISSSDRFMAVLMHYISIFSLRKKSEEVYREQLARIDTTKRVLVGSRKQSKKKFPTRGIEPRPPRT
jgi:hypothetical protein